MQHLLKEYFSFSKKERNAVYVLLLLIVGCIVLPYFITTPPPKLVVDKTITNQLTAMEAGNTLNVGENNNNANSRPFENFSFDPNTLDETGWLRLGLREKTVATILNYRSKGGRFKNAEDIRKIWGLEKEVADRIIPFAVVEQKAFTPYKTKNATTIKSKPSVVDVNTATVDELKNLPGMVYPNQYRIVKYRERLGGFLTLQQVKEVQGLPDSVYQSILPYLQLKNTTIQKLNINVATDFDLSKHPYIDKNIAKAIVIYRNQHGAYKTVDDLKKIIIISPAAFAKMLPYITAE